MFFIHTTPARTYFVKWLSLSQVVFSKYTDLLPKEVLNEDAEELRKPDEETVQEVGDPA